MKPGLQRFYFIMYRAFISFLLVFSFPVKAQQLVLKNYGVKNGLPSSEIYCTFQDSKGFIWFGSDDGVSRFDGYTFKNYTTEDGLADNVIFEIFEDRHKRLWFRSLSGKLCYLQNDSIYRAGANEIIFGQMKNSIMVSLYVDSGDTVWCGLRFNDGFIKLLPGYDSAGFQKIPVNPGPYAMEIEDGHLISGSGISGQLKKRITYFSLFKKQRFIKNTEVPDIDPTHVFYCMPAPDTLLIADKQKLFLLQKNSISLLLSSHQLSEAQTLFLKQRGDYTWLGLYGKGVLRCSKDDLLSWKNTTRILDGFSVTDVLYDREGGTWFTTLENGVYYSSPARFISYQKTNELIAQKKYNIEKIGADHIVISTKINTLDIASPGRLIRNVSITDKKVSEVFENSGVSPALIATGNPSVPDSFMAYLWQKEKHAFKKIRYTENGPFVPLFFSADTVNKKSYFLDRYWIATLDDTDDYVKTLSSLPSRTFSFYRDAKGIIWLGCLNGLWSYEKNKFTYHGNENEYLKTAIEDIKEGADGTRFFATRGNGIIICKDGKYSKLTTANGLASNNCKCIYIDKDGTLWVGSKNGICKVKKSSEGWQVLKFDLTDNEFSFEVFKIEKTQNTLWLFTNRGLLSYELSSNDAEVEPQIYITQFSVNEISHSKDSIRSFACNENYVRISYTGLSFQSLGKLYYTYKLDGLDTAWHATQSTSLQYPFLPPGNYTFYVKAISFGGTQSKNSAVISFSIHKPFWKTAWFITLLIVVTGAAVYLLFYYRLKGIQRKEEEKTIFNKQLAELEMKSLRSQMNPHFIFNAINSIQNYIVKSDSRTAQDYLAKFARLIRYVLENSKKETIALSNELETLQLYVELEQLRAPGKFIFKLNMQAGLQATTIFIPPLILQPYIENAILHGLMPLNGVMGELCVSIEKKDELPGGQAGKLICTIDDNGIGRKKAAELKQKKQLLHSSIGLSVTEERIKMAGLQKNGSGITVEDKTDSQGRACGTRICIFIALDK